MSASDLEPPVGVFLHVATLGRYQEVADEVLTGVRTSGLLARADFVEVNVVGTGPVTVAVDDPKVRLVRRDDDVAAFEHPTLDSIRDHCLARPELRVLYLNCLGGRHVGPNWELRVEWRGLIQALLVEGAPRCLELLRDHDVVGVDWLERPMPHMTSNNWWARGDYVAGLPSLHAAVERLRATDLSAYRDLWPDEAMKVRHTGEFWIGMGAAPPRPASLFPLKGLGLPTTPFGAVPWWGLPGVEWSYLARRAVGGPRDPRRDRAFQLRRAKAQALFLARAIKRRLKG